MLTPFFDALALRGMNPVWLEELRRRAMEQQLLLFRTTDGRQLAASYPSKVWQQHLGTGAHISRSRVHSELGQLGPRRPAKPSVTSPRAKSCVGTVHPSSISARQPGSASVWADTPRIMSAFGSRVSKIGPTSAR